MNNVDILPWNDHFNTGLISIDKQHKKLVKILNSLASNIINNSKDDDLNVIFEELINYTIYHFQTEETIWNQYLPNDPLDSEHQAIHQQFIDTIIKLRDEQKTRSLIELAGESLSFLAHWLASHILETDRFMVHLIFALRDGLDLDAAKLKAKDEVSGHNRLLIDLILSTYGTLSTNTLHLISKLKHHQKIDKKANNPDHYNDMHLCLSTDFIDIEMILSQKF